jgi:hypothetical protein
MRKGIVLITMLLVILINQTSIAQNKKIETGLLIGHGFSSILNTNASLYFTDNYNGVFEVSPFYRINFEEAPFSLKFEYTQRTILSEFEFNEDFNARISQAFMGFNVKGSYTKIDPSIRAFEFFGGIGLYTLAQKRTPNPLSGLRSVDDGFAPYWGISFEADFSYSIPIDKYRVGMAWRIFALPNITFFNKNSVQEFYHLGSTLSIFTSF